VAKKAASKPVAFHPDAKVQGTMRIAPRKSRTNRSLWLWFVLIVVVGSVLVSAITSAVNFWLKGVHVSPEQTVPTPAITTFPVQRSSSYAGLDIMIVNAQYAAHFVDDDIRSGVGVVRLNMRVSNPTKEIIQVVYYEVARLLVPEMKQPLAPTNVQLSVGPRPGKSESGWIDFAVPQAVTLDMLTLRLGSTGLDETMVMIPLKGPFDARHFAERSIRQSMIIPYTFQGNLLRYHLKSVEVLYAYQGKQVKNGLQYYVFTFSVENPGSVDVSPGLSYDYIRLVVNGYSQPPKDATLPYTFKKKAQVNGLVMFLAPVRMKMVTLGFRAQMGAVQQNYEIHL
jgi:hypothetical protein